MTEQKYTPFLCSVHTHSRCCDGKNTLPEMAKAAYAAGVRYFGASGHSFSGAFDEELPVDPQEYRQEVLRIRQEYAGRMEILLGIEQDFYSVTPVPDWADYWIGSVHNLRDESAGEFHAVDWDAPRLEKAAQVLAHGDYLKLVRLYYRKVMEIAAQKPVILGHMDIVTKFNRQNKYFDESSAAYRSIALDALHAVDPTAVILEINTGAVSRGFRNEPYPALFILREWKRMGGRIIITSDAHSCENIIFGYRDAIKIAQAAGFQESVMLTMRGMVMAGLET